MFLFRFFAQKSFAPAVVFCISAALLFTGCQTDTESDHADTGFIPEGVWTDDYGSFYNISKSSLEYNDGYSIFIGSIMEAIDFSPDAGVLLVQITESAIPEEAGKFIGVYYKDYTVSHVFLANAIDGSYALILMDRLAHAKNTFNVDNVDTYVRYWGSGYNK